MGMAKKQMHKAVAIRAQALGLSPKEARFVEAYVRLGRQKDIAAELGVTQPRVSQMYNTPHIHEAIGREMQWQNARRANKALVMLEELADTTEEDNVKLAAIKEMINRGIGPPTQTTVHRHEIEKDTGDLMERIAELQQELGFSHGEIIEAEVVEEPEEEPRRTRLERLPFRPA